MSDPLNMILMLNNTTPLPANWSITPRDAAPIEGTQGPRSWSIVSVQFAAHYEICFEGVCNQTNNPNSCATYDGSRVAITEPGA